MGLHQIKVRGAKDGVEAKRAWFRFPTPVLMQSTGGDKPERQTDPELERRAIGDGERSM